MVRPASELHGVVPGRYGMSRAMPDGSTMAQLARQTVAIVAAGGAAQAGSATGYAIAVPFGGSSIIDFSLSNCLNSGIHLLTQYQSHSSSITCSALVVSRRALQQLSSCPHKNSSDDWYKARPTRVQNLGSSAAMTRSLVRRRPHLQVDYTRMLYSSTRRRHDGGLRRGSVRRPRSSSA